MAPKAGLKVSSPCRYHQVVVVAFFPSRVPSKRFSFLVLLEGTLGHIRNKKAEGTALKVLAKIKNVLAF